MMEHTAGVRSTAGLWRPMGKGRATSTRPIRLFPTMSPALRTEPGILGVPLMCWSGESLSSGCLSLASERGVPWAHSWEVRYPWGQDRPGFESRLCHFLRSDSDPCSPPWRHGEKAQGQGRGGSHSNPRHVLGWLRMARLPWWALGSGRHWTGRTHPDLGRERLQGQNPAQQLARTRDKWLLSKPVQLSPSLEQQWQVFWKMIIRVILPFNDIYGARTLGQVGGGG